MPKSSAVSCMILALLACAAPRAEESPRTGSEYEYARRLLAQADPSLASGELVERLARGMEGDPRPPRRLESKLVLALLRRTEARHATPAKREQLLGEAERLYREFLAAGAGHALYETGRREAAELQLDYARAMVRAAEETPAGAPALRAKAARLFEEKAREHAGRAEPLRPEVTRLMNEIGELEDEARRAKLLPALQKALSAYLDEERPHVLLRVEALDALAPDSAERREAARALVAHLDAQLGSEDLGLLDDLCVWFGCMKGRAFARVQDEAQAVAAWQEALSYDLSEYPPQAREALGEIRKAILLDMISMKERGAEKNPERCAEIVRIVKAAFFPPADAEMRRLYDEPAGKSLRISMAQALARQPEAGAAEYEQALNDLHAVVRAGPPWSNNAARAMAELARRGRAAGVRFTLPAESWLAVAHGQFLEAMDAWRRARELEGGEAAQAQAEAGERFRGAVPFYQRAVEEARKQGADPAVRLRVEPQAWFELGLAYLRQEDYEAAILACDALEAAFAPAARAKWLPDPKRDPAFQRRKDVQGALAELDRADEQDPAREGWRAKARRNRSHAFQALSRINPHLALRYADEDTRHGPRLEAKVALGDAARLAGEGRRLVQAGQRREALERLAEALAGFERAAAAYEALPEDEPRRDELLFQAASAWTNAQILAAEPPLKDAPAGARLPELTAKALAALARFEVFAAAHPEPGAERAAARARLLESAAFHRVLIHYGARDWSALLEAGAAYEAFEAQGAEPSRLALARLRRFQALTELARSAPPEEAAAKLAAAEALAAKFEAQPEYAGFAARALAARYHELARAAEAQARPAAALYAKAADYLGQEFAARAAPALDDYARMLSLLRHAGRARQAADLAAELLAKFDPQAKNARIGDEEWPIVLKAMLGMLRFDDRAVWQRCKQDHETLVDLLYDTREGVAHRGVPARRPAHDKLDEDYDKALAQLATIRRNHPDAPTVQPRGDADRFRGESFLGAIERELEFRRGILGTRALLVELALQVAEAAGQEDVAMRYRQVADAQLQIQIAHYGDSQDLRFQSAQLKAANGAYAEALEILYALKREAPDRDAPWYVRVSRRASEVHFMKGEYAAAAEYPGMLEAVGVGAAWKDKHWPEMDGFLKDCYARGAPEPVRTPRPAAGVLPEVRGADEERLDELKRIEAAGRAHPEILTPDFLWQLDFMTKKVAHRKAFVELERKVLEARAQGREEALPLAERERHAQLLRLVEAEDAAWRADGAYRKQLGIHGGPAETPPEARAARAEALQKVAELRAELGP
ncbi:MAG: hypothetical protein M5U26_05910 [Planctomycetota bacterium]|nr:hypothetical protein [Planctomycetota bacterium]